ncbi:MAG: hypothetical protein M1514_01970 [Patescibacteria group bacterium]|nr:hypothetical protein [Patescibacteria group bacterium]
MTELKEIKGPKQISEQLIQLGIKDQEMRTAFRVDQKIDKENTQELKEIIKKIGWPTISKVGPIASWAAWLIAQHADHDPEFQKECLSLIEDCYQKGDVNPLNLAYLTDRVAVNFGQKQIYGTQWKNNEVKPIENPENLDQRRQKMGLWPFELSQRFRQGKLTTNELAKLKTQQEKGKIGPFGVSRM